MHTLNYGNVGFPIEFKIPIIYQNLSRRLLNALVESQETTSLGRLSPEIARIIHRWMQTMVQRTVKELSWQFNMQCDADVFKR